MIRKSILAASLLAVALGTLAVGTAQASSPSTSKPVTFTGKITCALAKGSAITIKPGLLLTTNRKVTITTTVSLKDCKGKTSEGGSKILSGKVTGVSRADTSCVGLTTPPLPSAKGDVVWKTKGAPAAKTSVTLTKGDLNSTTLVETYSTSQKGSFAGKGSVSVKVAASLSQLEAACETPTGLTKITLSSGTVSLG